MVSVAAPNRPNLHTEILSQLATKPMKLYLFYEAFNEWLPQSNRRHVSTIPPSWSICARKADRSELLRVHSAEYIQQLEQTEGKRSVYLATQLDRSTMLNHLDRRWFF